MPVGTIPFLERFLKITSVYFEMAPKRITSIQSDYPILISSRFLVIFIGVVGASVKYDAE